MGWQEQVTAQRMALAAAQRRHNQGWIGLAWRTLASAQGLLGDYDDAKEHYRCALAVATELDRGNA